jgi:hypothetical protein
LAGLLDTFLSEIGPTCDVNSHIEMAAAEEEVPLDTALEEDEDEEPEPLGLSDRAERKPALESNHAWNVVALLVFVALAFTELR